MAWYEVECTECGKKFDVQLYGKMKYREWKVEHYAWLCDECKAKKREEEARKAAEKSQEMQLPELIGSEKQVKWALQIRLQAIKEIEKQLEAYQALSSINPDGEPEQEEFLMKFGFEEMLKEQKASWWIDNRYMSFGVIAIQRGKQVVNKLATGDQNGRS